MNYILPPLSFDQYYRPRIRPNRVYTLRPFEQLSTITLFRTQISYYIICRQILIFYFVKINLDDMAIEQIIALVAESSQSGHTWLTLFMLGWGGGEGAN